MTQDRPDHLILGPLAGAAGSLRLPGSKSISNRVLLLAALSRGRTRVRDLLDSDDTRVMLGALDALGVPVSRELADGKTDYFVDGVGGDFPVKSAELWMGNAGTAIRPLTAALALQGGDYTLTGVPRMHERPIGDLVDGLRQLGARIDYLGSEGYPPLRVGAGQVAGGGTIRVRGDASSQFITALLMSLPLTGAETRIEVVGELISKPYIDITIALMHRFGVEVRNEAYGAFVVPGRDYATPGEVFVEGDASSASYFLAAGAIGGGPVRVEGVGADSIQGDVRFADALAQMGARVTRGPNWIEAAAPASGRLRAIEIDCNAIPDAAMTLAVLALFAEGRTRLTNIASWRVKETDRIDAMAAELAKLGARVEAGPDALAVSPPEVWRSPAAGIDTYDDHRMAMCFSLAAFGPHALRINDPGCVAKTFPRYFDALAGVVRPGAAPVIAIDGPTASGKGTVAQRVAEALGFHYLDSGAIYRLIALASARAGIAEDDADALAALAARVDIGFRDGDAWLDGEPVGDAIRAEAIGKRASAIAVHPPLRAALLQRQRDFRRAPGLVGDGRDMATVVFPDAALKVFLTASAEARAQRRYKQLIEKGFSANIAVLLQDLKDRDARDAQRAAAPLKPAEGARQLDTSDMTADQAVAQVLDWYAQLPSGRP